MNLIDTVLNELHAANECRAAIHAAKYAAGGRIAHHYSDGYADEWVNLPANFSETARAIVLEICGARGVNPREIGFLVESA